MSDQHRADIAVIGGSGFYTLPGLHDARPVDIPTPFGATSDPIMLGTLDDSRVAFIARHGAGHRLLPSEVPSRANMYALRSLGVTRVLAVSAVGSLREEIAPLHAVTPDQVIDRTTARPSTFFGDGIVAHVGFADPFCADLQRTLAAATREAGVTVHERGTLVVINGPAFSTRAESEMHRAWGGAIVGMTALPEAKLAREAALCYGALCFVTDYDVWRGPDDDVTAAKVIENLSRNVERGRAAVAATIATVAGQPRRCDCGAALDGAILNAREVSPEARKRLAVLLGGDATVGGGGGD